MLVTVVVVVVFRRDRRALRDIILPENARGSPLHILVAARVFRLWENNNPDQSDLVTELVERKVDKKFCFQAPEDGQSATYSASELRRIYNRRGEEVEILMKSLSDKQIKAGPALRAVPLLAPRDPDRRRHLRRMSSRSQHLLENGAIPWVETRLRKRAGDVTTGAGEQRASEGSGAGVERLPFAGGRIDHEGTASKRPRVMRALDGKLYVLPSCLSCFRGRIIIYVRLRTFLIDGQRIYPEESPMARSSLPKTFYSLFGYTRENMLIMRCVCEAGSP